MLLSHIIDLFLTVFGGAAGGLVVHLIANRQQRLRIKKQELKTRRFQILQLRQLISTSQSNMPLSLFFSPPNPTNSSLSESSPPSDSQISLMESYFQLYNSLNTVIDIANSQITLTEKFQLTSHFTKLLTAREDYHRAPNSPDGSLSRTFFDSDPFPSLSKNLASLKWLDMPDT